MKKQYLPANIRKGVTSTAALQHLATIGATHSRYGVEITSFNHGRDVNGNGTAHYECVLIGYTGEKENRLSTIVESGKRREQIGYSGQNEAALYALDKLGYTVDVSNGGSYDYQGEAIYPLLNFPAKGGNDE